MPSRRRRRSGYRPGQLSPQLQQAIADEARTVADLDEPLVVIAAVGDVFAALDDALEQLALPRLRAVADMRRQG